uniref:Uncharacterized protein n=1 Tax=Rhizophora mucronata TaxID=61149 RepID=A0A2P2MD73_RHIMU
MMLTWDGDVEIVVT